jgi:FMN-dependent oxidoreductase (nitrilotriacetate monooxygenase family)
MMNAARRTMRLGMSMRGIGYHVAAWRHPDTPSGGQMELPFYTRVAQAAERGLFDMVFLADGIAVRAVDTPPGSMSRGATNIVDLEPLTLLAALATQTRRVGLVATASTTYNEPYHIARKFASLDHLSGGRAGWNCVTSWTDEEARNFNRDSHLDYETRYERAEEFLKVVRALWDSWEPDAFLRDKASGVFFDAAKMHRLDHKGRFFQVQGPLNVAPCPQGHPVVVQAGASDQGQELAAATADIVFAASQRLEDAQAYYASVKGRMAKYGRRPDDLKILPGLSVIIGRTEQEARDKLQALQDLIDPLVGLAALGRTMGDLSGHDIDGPVPEPVNPPLRSRAEVLFNLAQREKLTIRQLYLRTVVSSGHRSVVGSPAQVVDAMEAWFVNGAADGYNILPAQQPNGIEDFVELVVPELQRRGLFRTEYESTLLRENLGLPARPRPNMAEKPGAKDQRRIIDSTSWTGDLQDTPEPLPLGFQWPTEFKHTKAPAMPASERWAMFIVAGFLGIGPFFMRMLWTSILASHSPLHPSPQTGHATALQVGGGRGPSMTIYVTPAEAFVGNGLMILGLILPAAYLLGYWIWVKLRRR